MVYLGDDHLVQEQEESGMSACPETECVEVTVFVQDSLGLHARPAARLALLAQQFQAEVHLEHAGRRANAKSILDILSLAAARGTSLTLSCNGTDAHEASAALEELFRTSLFSGNL